MESLSQQAKARYDLIVIDTPPLTAVSDAFPLLGKVDGVIIVGRVGRNRRDVAQRLHETLTGAGAPLLGVVANGFKSGRLGGYGYGYSYDYAAGSRGAGPRMAPRRRTALRGPGSLCRRARLEDGPRSSCSRVGDALRWGL
jgi:Mrp family chromosome partitioning ATPase